MKPNEEEQPRALLFGNAFLKLQEVQLLTHNSFAIKAVKENLDPERFDFVGKFDLLLFNCNTTDINYMAKLIKVCHYCKGIPIILIVDRLDLKNVIEAFREGVSDACLFPDFKDSLYDLMTIALQRFTSASPNLSLREWLKTKIAAAGGQEIHLIHPSMREGLEFNKPPEVKKHKIFVRFFGTFKVWIDGEEVKIPSAPRVRAIVAWFFYHQTVKYHRDRIARLLWNDMDVSSARNNLSVNLSTVRKVFHPLLDAELICSSDECYYLNPCWDISSDVEQYRQNMQLGKAAKCTGNEAEAIRVFQLMTQHTQLSFLEDQLREPWTDTIREEFKDKNNGVLEYIYNYQINHGAYEDAVETLRLAIQIDDCQEDVHFKIFNCYMALGKTSMAQKQKQECQRILKEKMNINRLSKRWEVETLQ